MSNYSNQHFVPQYYFRYFSKDGKSICLLNRNNGATIESASIKGQASKKNFYGNDEVEQTLSKIDTAFNNALNQLRINPCFENCSAENYSLLLQNILLQKSRTLSARNKSKASEDKLLQLFWECEVKNDDSLNEKTKNDFLEYISCFEANPKQYQLVEMSVALESIKHLGDLLPVFLNNKTDIPFIFGDAPVVFLNPFLKNVKRRGVLGAQTPGLIIIFPLDDKNCIMLIDKINYRIKNLCSSVLPIKNLKDISALNKLQIHNATNSVYFSDYNHSGYVSELWRQEKRRLVEHKGYVNTAPGFNQDGQLLGDIYHFFEKQLPFIPKFSFLKYQMLAEMKYRFTRRKEYN